MIDFILIEIIPMANARNQKLSGIFYCPMEQKTMIQIKMKCRCGASLELMDDKLIPTIVKFADLFRFDHAHCEIRIENTVKRKTRQIEILELELK